MCNTTYSLKALCFLYPSIKRESNVFTLIVLTNAQKKKKSKMLCFCLVISRKSHYVPYC